MLRCVATLLILLLGLSSVYGLGSISFLITDEDPTTGLQVDATILVGDSIEVTMILNPPPEIPVRFDIVTTTPSIIYPSHDTITFNRGVNRGTITLESPEDGKIGIATILVVPEKLGFYRPTSLSVLVQGIATLVQVEDCVAVSLPAKFEIKLWPPSPDNDVFSIHSSNGIVSNNTFEFVTGDITGEFTFTGRAIGNSSITIESDFYVSTTLHFQTFGRIITETNLRAVQGAPSEVSLTISPTASSLPIVAYTSNAVIVPFGNNFDASTEAVEFEVVPIYFGFSNVTYTATNYCPHYDYYTVGEAPLCDLLSEANIDGSECYECPGSQYNYYGEAEVCSGVGNCTYTHCFTDRVTCTCESDYIGSACQWALFSFDYDTRTLDEFDFSLNIAFYLSDTLSLYFLGEGNLIDEEFQPGTIIAALYPFLGAIDPDFNSPEGAEYTEVSFYVETTCYDNALITDKFNSPVEVEISLGLNADTFTHRTLLELQLCWWNSTSEKFVDSIEDCLASGFEDVQRSVDLFSYTFTTYICRPGQYALFLIPISAPVPNTGNTNNPHPGAEDVSDTFFLISTGWQQAPPLPLPDVALNFDPSPLLRNQPFGSQSSASALLVSFGVLLLAFILHL